MPEDPQVPLNIRRYALHAEIASGGMAAVSFACNPPYSIDASGRRIFKLECL